MSITVEERLSQLYEVRRLMYHPVSGMEAKGRYDPLRKNYVPFSRVQMAEAREQVNKHIVFYEGLLSPSGKLRAGEAPVWASHPVDVKLSNIMPIPGWVVIRENFAPKETAILAGYMIIIPELGTRATMWGEIVNIALTDGVALGLSVGDGIIYREWSGARWDFNGEAVLIMRKEDILGKIVK